MSFVFFDRAVEVRIGIPGNPQGTIMGIGRSWSDLKIEFQVSRSLSRDPNTCQVKLYNLDEVSLGIIQATGAFIQVLAGYKPFPSLIFSGNVAKRGVTIEKNDVDRVVTIEAGDGELSNTSSRFDWHYAAGTPVNLILANIIVNLGVGLGPGSPTLPPKVLPNDRTFYGKATDALDELVGEAGGSWSIQDGNLELLLGDQPTAELAVSLTPSSGLIGAPQRTDKGISIKSLLHPDIRPGRPLHILSERVIGFFKPKTVSHSGDTEGGSWQTEVEAVPLG